MGKHLLVLLLLLALGWTAFSQNWVQINRTASRLMDEGRPDAAKSLYQKALETISPEDSSGMAVLLQNLASAYYSLGNYYDALGCLDSTETLYGANDKRRYASLLNTRASIYQEIGNTDEASKDFSSALTLLRGEPEEAAIHLNLAALQLRCNKPEPAQNNSFQALRKTCDPLDSLIAYRLLCQASAVSSDCIDALYYQHQATEILNRCFRDDKYQNLWQNTADAYCLELLGYIQEARQVYESIYPEWLTLYGRDNPECMTVCYSLAKVALLEGNETLALDTYLDYIKQKTSYMRTEMVRFGQDDLRAFWKKSRGGVIEAPLYAAVAARKHPEALGELLDAVILVKSFNRNSIRSLRSIVQLAGSSKLDSLLVSLLESRSDLTHYDKKQSGQLEKQLLSELKKEGFVSDSSLFPSWKTSARSLSPKSVAVEFTHCETESGKDFYGAFVYKHTDSRPVFIPLPTVPFMPGTAPQWEEMREMYKCIWKPLEPFIENVDTVFFAPAGEWHLIPMEVLPDHNGRLFREKHKAAYRLVTTMDIPAIRHKFTIGESILFGDMDYQIPPSSRAYGYLTNLYPLPGSAREMDYASSLLADKPHRIFRKAEATEKAFRSLAIDPGANTALYLSTHGAFFSFTTALSLMYYGDNYPHQILRDNPLLRSVLFMSGAYEQWLSKHHNPIDDATLTAQEISEMDLRGVSLVVLSACESGVGENDPEGILSFPCAFKLAGAGATVASLWRVNDEATSEMMCAFYEEIINGKSPEHALGAATDKIRCKPEYQSPIYWAPFVVFR